MKKKKKKNSICFIKKVILLQNNANNASHIITVTKLALLHLEWEVLNHLVYILRVSDFSILPVHA